MKVVKCGVLAIIMLSTVFKSYPQSLLISNKENSVNSYMQVVDKVYKSKNKYLDINVIIPQFTEVNNKDEQKKINDKIVLETELWINDVQKIADEYFKDGTAPLYPYQLYSRYEVTSNNKILSLYIDNYQYTGGAHGITARIAYTVDKNSGKVLGIQDLFKDSYDYKKDIDYAINDIISRNPERFFYGKEGFNGINNEAKYFIRNENLVIYFAPYEIAPYAAGLPEFEIPIKNFNGNFVYNEF